MAVLILDPTLEQRVRAERGDKTRDEVWDGVLVMSPVADVEHQYIAGELQFIFRTIVGPLAEGCVFGPVNVSDREQGWLENVREPDVSVFLRDNPARYCGSHWFGGPDLAVEIVSPYDRSRDKGLFYAKVGVREFVVIDRNPWAIELYRPEGGGMRRVGRSTVGVSEALALGVLPLSLRLIAGKSRPSIEVAHEFDGRLWSIEFI